MMQSNRRRHHAVAIPLPAQGHLNPLMRLCRALSSHADFTITLVNTDFVQRRFQDVQAQEQQQHEEEEQQQQQQLLDRNYRTTHPANITPVRGGSKLANQKDMITASSNITSTHGDDASAAADAGDAQQQQLEQLQQRLHDNVVIPANIMSKHGGRPAQEEITGANSTSTHGVATADDEVVVHVKEQSDMNNIRSTQIPIEGLDLSNDFRLSLELFFQTLERHMPAALEGLLLHAHQALGPPPLTCLISDIAITGPTQPVADSFHLPRIAFYPSSAATLLLTLHVLRGDHISYPQVKEALKSREQAGREVLCEGLEGLPTIYNTDLLNFKHVEDNNDYLWENCTLGVLQESMSKAHAVVVNSFDALEGPALRALTELLSIPVYAVGPLVQPPLEGNNTSLWKEDEACLLWLDQQPVGSVLYISFGSFTLLSQVQFEEFVAGLLACEQRFLWVFRPDLIENSPFLTFPMGLLGKAQGNACAVRWAPQLRVLSHPSVGGFLTHCGWNSTIESIAHGVPMLCWPYFVDQFLNAKFIVEEWKIGLRFQEDGGKLQLVKRDQVESVIRALMMQGEERESMRRRVVELKEAGHASLQPPGGHSWEHMEALVLSLG